MSTPYLALSGPDKQGSLFFINQQGFRTPLFAVQVFKHSKPNLRIFRARPYGVQQPIATSSSSSLSGTVTLSLHGQEIKMKVGNESLRPIMTFKNSLGKFKWRPSDSGSTQELWDENGMLLARYKTISFREPTLEILVPGNEFFIDMVVSTGVALWREDHKDMKILETVIDVAGSV